HFTGFAAFFFCCKCQTPEEMHYTFHDYLNRYRIQQAVKKMKETDYKVYEIADMVGFSDYKYFIQVFKKYVGMSPKKFFEQSGNS
ncbi:helix-turn-helix transcriptional regulator, partial [uncultured Megasphaera sp.]|uniref:helix-turn-helix domain-containing protein n=1 Tax=uncultured Megasphaera sp. TaxID=165188 RepID=UPI00261CA4BA